MCPETVLVNVSKKTNTNPNLILTLLIGSRLDGEVRISHRPHDYNTNTSVANVDLSAEKNITFY